MHLLNFYILGVDEPFAICNKQGNKKYKLCVIILLIL